MRLATIEHRGATHAARVEDDGLHLLDAPDVGSLLADPAWQEVARRGDQVVEGDAVRWLPVVPHPSKTVCVGLNYRSHILEMGRDLPEHPTLFAKFEESLIGPFDPIAIPAESAQMDWEAELAVVIGRTVRRADRAAAERAIAGFTVMNDVTARDWQFRTREWLQGKTFEGTTPLGPLLVTPDELPGGCAPAVEISCLVDGAAVQRANTSDLVFGPADLVSYVSTIVTLRPGDVIATGTPGGVGHAREPAVYLQPGQTLQTRIEGIGELRNATRAER